MRRVTQPDFKLAYQSLSKFSKKGQRIYGTSCIASLGKTDLVSHLLTQVGNHEYTQLKLYVSCGLLKTLGRSIPLRSRRAILLRQLPRFVQARLTSTTLSLPKHP